MKQFNVVNMLRCEKCNKLIDDNEKAMISHTKKNLEERSFHRNFIPIKSVLGDLID